VLQVNLQGKNEVNVNAENWSNKLQQQLTFLSLSWRMWWSQSIPALCKEELHLTYNEASNYNASDVAVIFRS
jgi:hypothetical protein